jgi:hypothetical protein
MATSLGICLLLLLCGVTLGQGESATPVQDYFPVGVASSPGLTEAPDAYVGPNPTSPAPLTFSPTPSPPVPGAASLPVALRNRVDVTCTFFDEGNVVEYRELFSRLVSDWITSGSSDHSMRLQLVLTNLLSKFARGTTLSWLYRPDAVQTRLVPLRTLSFSSGAGGGGGASLYSVPQMPGPVALDYGSQVVASFVILPLVANNNTPTSSAQPIPVRSTQAGGQYEYPYTTAVVGSNTEGPLYATSRTSTAPTAETDALCEALSAAFDEVILSQRREVLTSLSSSSAWLLSGVLNVKCPRMVPKAPLSATVGVNYLWIAFIVLGICCLSGAVYAMFCRTRSDDDVDINADEKEKVAAAARKGIPTIAVDGGGVGSEEEQKRRLRDAELFSDANNDLASRIDSKTESIYEVHSERLQILDARKKQRIRDLVSKALTGDATIYGASDEEREIVAMILRNPRFDGGRLTQDAESLSPVEVVLNHDRLFLLPPSNIQLSTKVTGKRGRVSSVSFPAHVSTDGSVEMGMMESRNSLRVEDVVSAGSAAARMAAAQEQDPSELALTNEPSQEIGNSVPPPLKMKKDDASGGDEEEAVDEATKINRMITEAALRNVQRREGQAPQEGASSSIKHRLQRILDEEDGLL